jgi:putative glycosyltransferase (TIGR04372 family)
MKLFHLSHQKFKTRRILRVIFLLISLIRNIISNLKVSEFEKLLESEISSHRNFIATTDPNFLESFSDRWTNATVLALRGHYHESVLARKEMLISARKISGLDENFVPKVLEIGWTTHFGHLASLKIFSDAQSLGIIPTDRRLVLKSSKLNPNRPIFRYLSNYFDFWSAGSPNSLLSIDSFFSFTEKVSMVTASGNQFLELHQLIAATEKKFRNPTSAISRNKLNFLDEENAAFYDVANQSKLPKQDWFCTLHIRETSDKYASRNSNPEKFLALINQVVSDGGFVVKIGSASNSDFSEINGCLDLTKTRETQNRGKLHEFAILNSRFLITNQSGPHVFAHAFGIPVFLVDSVAIGKTSYDTRNFSMSLPKNILFRNQKMSWEEIAERNLLFLETPLAEKDIFFQENSPEALVEAFAEFQYILKHDWQMYSNPTSFQSAKINAGGLGEGYIFSGFFST